jgi:hypothetical protein
MTKLHVQKGLLGVAIAAVALATAGSARAAGQASDKEKRQSGSSPSDDAPGGQEGNTSITLAERSGSTDAPKSKDEEKKKEDDHPFYVGVDFVVGTAHTPTVTVPTTSTGFPTSPVIATTRVTSYSFIFNGGLQLTEGFEVRFRVPLENATLFTPDDHRGASAFGDIEIEPEGRIKLADGLHLKLALGIALPTAQGGEIPANAAAIPSVGSGTGPGSGIDYSAYDRYAAQRSAAMVRGYEEDELFAPSHLGIVPKITLAWASDSVRIDPWVKLENLISTESGGKFIDELVFGVNLGYRASRAFEPGVRVWASVPVSNAEFTSTVAVAEPQLLFHFRPVDLSAGVILPFAGPLTSPYDVGVRLAAGFRF